MNYWLSTFPPPPDVSRSLPSRVRELPKFHLRSRADRESPPESTFASRETPPKLPRLLKLRTCGHGPREPAVGIAPKRRERQRELRHESQGSRIAIVALAGALPGLPRLGSRWGVPLPTAARWRSRGGWRKSGARQLLGRVRCRSGTGTSKLGRGNRCTPCETWRGASRCKLISRQIGRAHV